MAQQKLQETGLPQKLADHSAAAQETAQKKLDEYSTEVCTLTRGPVLLQHICS